MEHPIKQTLRDMLDALARHLHKRINSPDVTAAEMRVCSDLCRYLNISGEKVRSSPLYRLASALPTTAELISMRHTRPFGIDDDKGD